MERKRPYWQVAVSLVFSILATAAFIILGVKAIGFLMPFVVGWIISAIATPLVNWLEKRLKIVKKLGTAMIVIMVIGLIVLVGYFAVSRIAAEVTDLIQNFPDIYAQLEEGMREIGNTLSGAFSRLPRGVQNGWTTIVENLDTYMGNLVSKISEPTVTAAGNFAKRLPSYLISFIVAILAAYFFTIQREEVIAWFHKIAPPSVEKRMILVMDNLKYAVGGYFKAQFKIMIVVCLILIVGFVILDVHFYFLLAILIALLDFLPFFGTGTALIPWGLYKLMVGDYKMVIGLVILYGVTQLVRQLIQPKLVGDSMGLKPLLTLVFLYAGYKIGGVIAMIFAVPIGMIVMNLYKAGAFDYILDDVKILMEGLLKLRE